MRLTAIRPPSVAGTFYPARPDALATMVAELLTVADRLSPPADPLPREVLGLLVPHAGLVYSGVIAAAGWRLLGMVPADPPPTIVLLGTNHGAGWLDGVAAWEDGGWRTPLGDVAIDADLAAAICELGPPFTVDHAAHVGEHSIEVQLPLLQVVRPGAAIVPLSVAAGTGAQAVAAGARLGELLARHRATGRQIVIAISSDMAHYPAHAACAQVTQDLLGPLLRLEPDLLARTERRATDGLTPGLVCGMCGIQPTVLGLAALRGLGATRGIRLAAATSADAGGPPDRTVGYLAVAFTA
jgi:AmmeMemoRadiSam system protein B